MDYYLVINMFCHRLFCKAERKIFAVKLIHITKLCYKLTVDILMKMVLNSQELNGSTVNF